MSHTGWSWLSCCLTLALAPGEPFLDLSYEQALARSKEQGKLLLVDATASWCPPCKRMEKETWPTEPVRTWLAEHAVTIQIDVDEERGLAQSLKIEAMPTVIAFKDGVEFDRIVGFRDSEGLLAWLDGVAAGKRSGDAVRERAQTLAGSEDVDERYDLAKDLLRQRDYESAAQQYVWLWKNTRGVPSYGGVRLSFMLSDIHRLCDAYEPARDAFAEFHDVLDTKLNTTGSMLYDDWAEWFALGSEFEGDARVLAFYEAHHDADGRLQYPGRLGMLSDYVSAQFFDVLLEHGRYADAGRLVPDLEAAAQRKLMQARMIKSMTGKAPDESHSMDDYFRSSLQTDLSRLRASALATGREQAAESIAKMLVDEYDDADTRMALVRLAVEVGHTGPQEATWLAEAEQRGADVEDVAALRAKLASSHGAPAEPAAAPAAETDAALPGDGR